MRKFCDYSFLEELSPFSSPLNVVNGLLLPFGSIRVSSGRTVWIFRSMSKLLHGTFHFRQTDLFFLYAAGLGKRFVHFCAWLLQSIKSYDVISRSYWRRCY